MQKWSFGFTPLFRDSLSRQWGEKRGWLPESSKGKIDPPNKFDTNKCLNEDHKKQNNLMKTVLPLTMQVKLQVLAHQKETL